MVDRQSTVAIGLGWRNSGKDTGRTACFYRPSTWWWWWWWWWWRWLLARLTSKQHASLSPDGSTFNIARAATLTPKWHI